MRSYLFLLPLLLLVLTSPVTGNAESPNRCMTEPIQHDDSFTSFPIRTATMQKSGDYMTETYPQPVLTDDAQAAIAASPSWLEEDLIIAFSEMEDLEQDRFAGKILNAAYPDWRDEIAFCIAHIMPSALTHNLFDDRLLDVNVQWIYELDDDLQYVRLVEYGDSTQGGTDYYTTTAYIIDEGSGPFEVEIPRDIYYWWVVHPIITEERAGFVNPETAEITTPENGGVFWRQYFWESDPVYDYRTNGSWNCHLFGDVALLPTHLWDRQEASLPSGREFTADCSAVDIVSNWVLDVVHWGATYPRPVQPVAIAYDHDGNCGEYQDILGAALRAAMIPANGTITIVDDHVWNEFWDEGWVPIGDSDHSNIGSYGNGADYTYGGWKDISAAYALRGDKLNINRTASYTESCTVTATVVDNSGNPVDGAYVKILGQSYYNPNNFGVCIEGYTDTNGQLILDLGDNRDFKGEVYSHIGSFGTTLIIEDTLPGENYPFDVTLPGTMDIPQVTDAGTPPNDMPKWRLSADIDVPYAILYGLKKAPTGSDLFRTSKIRVEPGSVDIFLLNPLQKIDYNDDLPFNAYHVDRETDSFSEQITLNENEYTLVVSNQHHHGHREIIDISLQLEQYDSDTWTEVESIERRVSLDPGEVYLVTFGQGTFNMKFDIPSREFGEGDEFYLDLLLTNTTNTAIEADLYVLLDVYGSYYSYPEWKNIYDGLDYTEISLPALYSETLNIMEPFIMPAVPDAGPFYFYCAAFHPGTLAVETLIGNVDVAEFYLSSYASRR